MARIKGSRELGGKFQEDGHGVARRPGRPESRGDHALAETGNKNP
jgi:hypothetical protein